VDPYVGQIFSIISNSFHKLPSGSLYQWKYCIITRHSAQHLPIDSLSGIGLGLIVVDRCLVFLLVCIEIPGVSCALVHLAAFRLVALLLASLSSARASSQFSVFGLISNCGMANHIIRRLCHRVHVGSKLRRSALLDRRLVRYTSRQCHAIIGSSSSASLSLPQFI